MNLKMLDFLLFLVLIQFDTIFCINPSHQTDLAKKLWSEHCEPKSMLLNDCNWCRCTKKMKYTCDSRVCSNVDMFEHFKDTITNLDPGMNGHGVWRSGKTICEPGVNYRKSSVICICTEDGIWPNPVCQDLFQVLHQVEPTDHVVPDNQACTPGKLHQIGCNVCYCTENGTIDPNKCTKKDCSTEVLQKTDEEQPPDEVYATCVDGTKYQFGCQPCHCLKNNRLICDACPSDTVCSNHKPGEYFTKDCNFCYCDKRETIYCTARNCLPIQVHIVSIPVGHYDLVEAPTHNIDCIPGTMYKRKCNTCHCFVIDKIKYFGCTTNHCHTNNGTLAPVYHWEDCVESTLYEVNNLICECSTQDGVKREYCFFGEQLKKLDKNSAVSIDTMHGYCEPLHYYQQDCNGCRCLADGKTMACTSKKCSETKESFTVEILPFVQNETYCPKGHKYNVDCNVCYCLPNGNALCSVKKCR